MKNTDDKNKEQKEINASGKENLLEIEFIGELAPTSKNLIRVLKIKLDDIGEIKEVPEDKS